MFARVMTIDLKPETIDQAVAEWPEHIAVFKKSGLHAGYMFVDRATGRALSITIWESREAQERNAVSPEQIRGRSAMLKYFKAPPTPSVFEVAAKVE